MLQDASLSGIKGIISLMFQVPDPGLMSQATSSSPVFACAIAADSCVSLESLQLANWTSYPSNKVLNYLYFARDLKSQQEEWEKGSFYFSTL